MILSPVVLVHITQSLTVVALVLVLGHAISLILRGILRRLHTPKSVHLIVTNVLWILLIWVGLLAILNILGLKQAVNLGTIGILALSFLIQGIAQSILQGFIILMEHDFDVGDYLTIGGESGVVTDIGLRLVYMKNDRGQTISIPTANIYSSTVIKGNVITANDTGATDNGTTSNSGIRVAQGPSRPTGPYLFRFVRPIGKLARLLRPDPQDASDIQSA